MVFRSGERHPCTRDVARLSESVKKRATGKCFFRFPKVEQHPKCMDERYPARKTIWKMCYKINTLKQRKTKF